MSEPDAEFVEASSGTDYSATEVTKDAREVRRAATEKSIYDKDTVCLEVLLDKNPSNPYKNKPFNKAYAKGVGERKEFLAIRMYQHACESDAQMCNQPGVVWAAKNSRTNHYTSKHGAITPDPDSGVVWACLKTSQRRDQIIHFVDGPKEPSPEAIKALLEVSADEADMHLQSAQGMEQLSEVAQADPAPDTEQDPALALPDPDVSAEQPPDLSAQLLEPHPVSAEQPDPGLQPAQGPEQHPDPDVSAEEHPDPKEDQTVSNRVLQLDAEELDEEEQKMMEDLANDQPLLGGLIDGFAQQSKGDFSDIVHAHICGGEDAQKIVREAHQVLHKRKLLETDARSHLNSVSAKQQKLQNDEQALMQELEELHKAVESKNELLTRARTQSLTVQEEKATAEKIVSECHTETKKSYRLQRFMHLEKFGQFA